MNIQLKDKSSVIYVLQKTFAHMALSKSLSFYPSELIQSLGIDPDIQCDVHEFFHRFITDFKSALSAIHQEHQHVVFELVLSM